MTNVFNQNEAFNTSHYLATFANPVLQIKEYTTPGSFNVTIPIDVEAITITGCGAGGSGFHGGSGYETSHKDSWGHVSYSYYPGYGGGGGAGANLTSVRKLVTPGAIYPLSVGAGALHVAGGNSTFDDLVFPGGPPGSGTSGGLDVVGMTADNIQGGNSAVAGKSSSYGLGGAPGIGWTGGGGGLKGLKGGKCAGGGGAYPGRATYAGAGQTGETGTEIGSGGGGGGGGGGAGGGSTPGNGGPGGPGYIAIIYMSKFTIP
jgi:hypothetical protein